MDEYDLILKEKENELKEIIKSAMAKAHDIGYDEGVEAEQAKAKKQAEGEK